MSSRRLPTPPVNKTPNRRRTSSITEKLRTRSLPLPLRPTGPVHGRHGLPPLSSITSDGHVGDPTWSHDRGPHYNPVTPLRLRYGSPSRPSSSLVDPRPSMSSPPVTVSLTLWVCETLPELGYTSGPVTGPGTTGSRSFLPINTVLILGDRGYHGGLSPVELVDAVISDPNVDLPPPDQCRGATGVLLYRFVEQGDTWVPIQKTTRGRTSTPPGGGEESRSHVHKREMSFTSAS